MSNQYTPITYDYVRQYLFERGFEILTDTYKNSTNSFNIKCPNGHITSSKWKYLRKNVYCQHCKREEIFNVFLKEVNELGKGEFEVLSLYESNAKPIEFLHKKCMRTFKKYRRNIKELGLTCTHCNLDDKRKPQEMFEYEVNKKYHGQYLVVGKYVNSNTKISIKHIDCGFEFTVIPDNFVNKDLKYNCPNCGERKRLRTTESVSKEISELTDGEYELISNYIKMSEKIHVRHKECMFSWWVESTSFLTMGTRCPECENKRKLAWIEQGRKTTEQFKQEVYNLVEDEYLVIEEYSNANFPILLRHNSCGYEWKSSPYNFLYNGVRCPDCGSNWKGEERIKQYFLSRNISFKRQYSFDECKHKKVLYFDFAITDSNSDLCFLCEYDGD